MITFQEESWGDYFSEAEGLWKEHYKELCQDPARMPMGPDVEYFKKCEELGLLVIVTARSAGELVGYYLAVIRPHSHYRTVLCAFEDSFWLHPSCRKGLVGAKLIRESERFLKKRGVKKVFNMSIESKPTGKLFLFLGYKKTHELYAKWIGE